MQGSQEDSALAAISRLPRSSASAITRPRFPESAGRTNSSHQSPSVFFHRTPNRLFTCTKELNARSKPRKPTRGSPESLRIIFGKTLFRSATKGRAHCKSFNPNGALRQKKRKEPVLARQSAADQTEQFKFKA